MKKNVIRILFIVLIMAISFISAWIIKPSVQFLGEPKKYKDFIYWGPCDRIGKSLKKIMTRATVYSPGDSSIYQYLIFKRYGTNAVLQVLDEGLEDDAADAEGTKYILKWTKSSGWKVTNCFIGIDYSPGRP